MKRRFLSAIIIALLFIVLICTYASAADVLEKTGHGDMFSLSGSSERFILLDSDEEGYFVITQKLYGTHLYDANDQSKFDVNNPDNMAHWLNNGFLTEGNNGQTLPEKIIEHLVERDWYVEESSPHSKYSEAYNVRAKVALLSSSEFDKYISVFGYGDDTSEPYWFLRSSSTTSTNENGAVMVSYTDKYLKTTGKNFRYYGVRPVFYLDKDFFEEVKLNLNDIYLGDNIKKVIRKKHTKNDLRNIYTSREIETIFDSSLKPIASNVMVKGFPAVGSTLTATYSFYSPEGDADAGSVIRWVKSKNKTVGYRAIAGAKGDSYTLTEADVGYYVKAEVIPKTKKMLGFAVSSPTPLSVIFPNYTPVASNVYLIGSNYVGARLILNYNYSDENYDKERGTQFVWERSKDGKIFTKIENANTVNYTITESDIGCFLRGGVTVKNNEGTGETVYTAASELIYKKPEAQNLRITSADGYVEASYSYIANTQEGNSVIQWEFSDKEDGVFRSLAHSGKRFDTSQLGGKYVRFTVVPHDYDGNSGDKEYSSVMKISGNSTKTVFSDTVQSLETSGGSAVYTSGAIAPTVITVDTENQTDGALLAGELYSLFTTKTAQGMRYTFILKDADAAAGSVKLCDVNEDITLTNIRTAMYDSNGASVSGNYTLWLERR